MATTPTYRQDPTTVVKVTQRLWSEEVARTDQEDVLAQPFDKAYEFSNGRTFVEKDRYGPTN